ncbi:alpha/beta hydrolase [Saccharopolyspora rhizosphaerae]|uniref:Alpha/beta hydrolase n=1 Tax=Saccharopolyspora rhizosphaerae TaxID=2492662 RepID=A0A426K090_9PSEU|nr:alpha/beta hydrolase [Saccharopolyspora rhizosphaerae]RRO18917.1 alpha/beta hydrolase [Saccharopolyspora rhizosphaerae]
MKRSIALGMAAVAALALAPAAASTAAARPATQFGPCPEDIAAPYPQLRCATIDVPLDHAHPDGEQVQLLVSKLPARNPQARRGSLLVNPGGPGGPGAEFAGTLGGRVPTGVRDSYDLVGFDTRHTAHSTPIRCVDPAQHWVSPLPDPDSSATREENWRRAQAYADGCAQRAGKYLPHLNTPTNARDMDRVRAALGEQKISFVGYSYGTYLGAVYGQLFPERVDRMVLDSSVNPDTSEIWYRNNLSQDVAAQRRLDHFFGWVARHDRTFHLGTEQRAVEAAWQRTQAELQRAPRGPLGSAELVEITFNALYGESSWQPLAQALADFQLRGNDRALAAMITPKDAPAENGNAVYTAVECADAPWPARRAEWERDSRRMASEHPFAAWFNSWSVAPCRTWQTPRQQPTKITGEDLPPVLMFNSEHDVATPHAGAVEMHRSLPSSLLVTERDAGKHGVFALAGNGEADRIGADYLVSGGLPPQDIAIPGHPEPDPLAPAARSYDLR